MKLLKKSGVAFVMIMMLMLNTVNVSASELSSEAVYDMEMGGTQHFVIQNEDGEVAEVIIEEVEGKSRIGSGDYKVSYKNTGAWEAGFYVEISSNKIVSAYSPFYSVATGSILAPSLTRSSTEEATFSFIYKQVAISYSTGVVARISGTDLIVGQK